MAAITGEERRLEWVGLVRGHSVHQCYVSNPTHGSPLAEEIPAPAPPPPCTALGERDILFFWSRSRESPGARSGSAFAKGLSS